MTEELKTLIAMYRKMNELSRENVKKANEAFDNHLKKIRALL